MTVVTEDFDLPAGVDPTRAVAVIQLFQGTDLPLKEARNTSNGHTVIGKREVTLDGVDVGSSAVGAWSLDLPANSLLSPGGTVWGRTLVGPRIESTTSYATVPTSGTPTWKSIETDPPDDLPTVVLSYELAVAEILNNLTITGFNGFNILPVPNMTVAVPDRPQPIYVSAQVWMEHASASNVNLISMVAVPGVTTIGQQLAADVGFVGAAGKECSPKAEARLNPHTTGNYQAHVYSDIAGNVNVIAGGSNPLRIKAIGA